MSVYSKIRGTQLDIFILGILSTSHGIKDHTDGVQVVDETGALLRNIIVRDAALASVANKDDCAPTYREMKRNNISLRGFFSGAGGPVGAAGYYICNLAGGAYFQGQIVYWDGVAVVSTMEQYEGMVCSPRVAVTGGAFQMIQNGSYILTAIGGGPVYTWTLMGDGTATLTGHNLTILIQFSWTDWPSLTKQSAANIPGTAFVVRTMMGVFNAFVAPIGNPTVTVDVNGAGSTPLRGAGDQNLGITSQYDVLTTEFVLAANGGPLRVNFDATAPTAGDAYLLAEYVVPNV